MGFNEEGTPKIGAVIWKKDFIDANKGAVERFVKTTNEVIAQINKDGRDSYKGTATEFNLISPDFFDAVAPEQYDKIVPATEENFKLVNEWCKEKGVSQHPARMPEKLAEFFINLTTTKNSLVLDPFGGSNTTGKTAENLGRRWISVERDPEYVLGSKGRFQKRK